MAHKTLINGTSYDVVGGSTLVDGTGRKISKGIALVDGTKREITFKSSVPFVWEEQGNDFASNQAWWSALAASVKDLDRASLVGQKSVIYLNQAFLGVNANVPISVICIGADQDGSNTLAFQLEGVFPSAVNFAVTSTPYWAASTALDNCKTFANIASAGNAMKLITKMSSSSSSYKANATDETTSKAWLPSVVEIGLSSSTSSWMPIGEYTKGCTTVYPYYNSNTTRRKLYLNADGTLPSNVSSNRRRYMLRTRYLAGSVTTSISLVDTDGAIYGSSASSNWDKYLCPAFVIG